MLRSSLFTVVAFALVAGASAQTPQRLGAERITGPIKNAGIYHVSTGTWTRTGGQVAALGGDVIYSNIVPSSYFTTAGGSGGFAAGSVVFDEGGLPGTTNGNPFGAGPNRDEYNVNGFQIGYCDLGAPGTGGWDISFWESFVSCTLPTTPADATVVLSMLPAAGCWTITIDLEGGEEFCLESDGGASNPGWNDDDARDAFGWSYTYSGTSGVTAGFFLTGDPINTDPTFLAGGRPLDGTNTYYGVDSLCGAATGTPGSAGPPPYNNPGATGYLTVDRFWIEGGINSGCYFFGGYTNLNTGCGVTSIPFASFHMEIYADTNDCDLGGGVETYCLSNPNSTGVNTGLEITNIVAADDDCVLRCTNLASNTLGFFITSQTQGFTANPGGSMGNICLQGNTGRFVGPGQIKSSGMGSEFTLDAGIGEWSTQAIPLATGQSYAAMAGTTSNFQAWHRDSSPGGATSNFSDGVEVTWL